jgi:endosialidase-like protein
MLNRIAHRLYNIQRILIENDVYKNTNLATSHCQPEGTMKFSLVKLSSICLCSLLIGFCDISTAQQIEAKLAGSTANEAFHVKDITGKILFSVYGDSKVAIGTSSYNNAQLFIEANADHAAVTANGRSSTTVISALNSITTGTGAAIKGTSNSAQGAGVFGDGFIGVHGDGSSIGVKGSGATGIFGTSGSLDDGTGVSGYGAIGVLGISDRIPGTGVQGEGTTGVIGITESGNAVTGLCMSNTSGLAGWFVGNVRISKRLSISTSAKAYDLHVDGSAGKPGGGSWSNASDLRLKNIDREYSKGLQEVIKLRPIEFHYKPDNARGYSPEREEIGFVAQEVQEVFPEAVTEGDDGYLDMNVHAINVAMVNAMKEMHVIMTQQQDMIDVLKQKVADLEQSNTSQKTEHASNTEMR